MDPVLEAPPRGVGGGGRSPVLWSFLVTGAYAHARAPLAGLAAMHTHSPSVWIGKGVPGPCLCERPEPSAMRLCFDTQAGPVPAERNLAGSTSASGDSELKQINK